MGRGSFYLVVTNRERLFKRFKPLYANTPDMPHCTMIFNASKDDHKSLLKLCGGEYFVDVAAEAWSDRVQAVRVVLPEQIKGFCQNTNPHITISWIDGALPVESNGMLLSDTRREDGMLLERAEKSRGQEYGEVRCTLEFMEWEVVCK